MQVYRPKYNTKPDWIIGVKSGTRTAQKSATPTIAAQNAPPTMHPMKHQIAANIQAVVVPQLQGGGVAMLGDEGGGPGSRANASEAEGKARFSRRNRSRS